MKCTPLSSVKTLFIIAAVAKVDKTYENVKSIQESIKFNNAEQGLSCDLKMCLCLCGKQSASATYPCPYCHAKTPFIEEAEGITLRSLHDHFTSFKESGMDLKDAKMFKNIVRKPLLHGDSDTLVLEVLNLPELHLMTGVTGKIVKEMENKCFESKAEGKLFFDKFLKDMNIKRCVYQGSESFEGNQARKLLKVKNVSKYMLK